MRTNGGQTGDLRKTTIRLGSTHEIRIVVGENQVKAVVKDLNQQIAGGSSSPTGNGAIDQE